MKCSTDFTVNNAFSSLSQSSTPFPILSTAIMPHSLISTFRPPVHPTLLRRQTSGLPRKSISKDSSFLILSTGTTRFQDFKIMAKKKPIEGVSDQMNAIASQNLDHAPARRRVRLAFTQVQEQLDHVLFKMAPSGIRTEEGEFVEQALADPLVLWFEINSKGQEIFCKSWLPKPGVRIKAAVCFVHGYGDTCTFFFEGIAKRIAAAGYGVYAIDHPGFGLSEGLHGYCSNFNDVVNNAIEQYTKIKGRPEVRGMPRFLLAQSMGGAVALKIHLKEQREWDGVVLVAPMCKIAEEMKPPEPLQKVLIFLSRIMPKAKLVPTKDLAELAFRDPQKRKLADYNVICYSDQTRLKTAVELLRITNELESEVEKVSAPLLILHGAADKVTDPNNSKFLYDMAASKDKTLKLYDGSYHCILEGESDERILEVLDDIVGWLDSHCSIR